MGGRWESACWDWHVIPFDLRPSPAQPGPLADPPAQRLKAALRWEKEWKWKWKEEGESQWERKGSSRISQGREAETRYPPWLIRCRVAPPPRNSSQASRSWTRSWGLGVGSIG